MDGEQLEDREKPLVLVADDDDVERFLLSETLEDAGFQVTSVENGALALQSARSLRPDIVLLDVVMPELDGFAVCAALRESPDCKHIPVLMVTGADDLESIQRAYDVGATDFMAKPINWTILCHRVRYLHRASSAFNDLRASKARLAEAQRIAQVGSWEWHIDNDKFIASEEAYRILGLERGEASITPTDLLERVHEEDRTQLKSYIEGAIRGGRGFEIDCRVVRGDDRERIIAIKAGQPADDGEVTGGSQRLAGTYQDITERRDIEARVHHLAYHDSLTSLPNRVLFRDRLGQALARAERESMMVAALYLDLDNFKEVNDTLGHIAGDNLLQAVSERIQDVVRGSDTVARLSGDEFAVIQVGLNQPEGSTTLAERLIKSISQPFNIDGQKVLIGASIGISVYPTDGDQADQLIMNADIALNRSKLEDRGAYRCFESGMDESLRARKALEQDLHLGLENEWFELHYQPQFRVTDGSLVGVEALLRLRHPERGLVPPGDFIPLAEQSRLIVPIGQWVIREACAQAMAWREAGMPEMRMAVNISPLQFTTDTLVPAVEAALSETCLEPEFLELEITESVLVRDTAETLRILRELQTLGVRIAMDDFGTGYSSLSYLRLFPFDRLKIDRSFIEGLDKDADADAIVRAIVSLGRSLNMETTAEGVETSEQLAYLRSQDCDEVQGFYFSRPVPAEQLASQVVELTEQVA